MNAYMLYYATGVIMIPVLLFLFYCQIKVKRAFRRYSSVHAMCGMTGAQAAARLLQLNGITDVQIRQIGDASPIITTRRIKKFVCPAMCITPPLWRPSALPVMRRATPASTHRAMHR